MTTLRPWQAFIPEAERALYNRIGLGKSEPFGEAPVLIVVDCTIAFTGTTSLPMDEALREFPTSCGEYAWEALPRIHKLIHLFRDRELPIVFTRDDVRGPGATKRAARTKREVGGKEFPDIIAPREGEWILDKSRASAFYGTPLASYLMQLRADSLVVCGTSTSGCVRATAVEGYSSGVNVFVVEDCCFDRATYPHLASLFDLHAKYATVMTLSELEDVLNARDTRNPAALGAHSASETQLASAGRLGEHRA